MTQCQQTRPHKPHTFDAGHGHTWTCGGIRPLRAVVDGPTTRGVVVTGLETILQQHRMLARGLSDYEAECSCGEWESGGMWERLPTDFDAHVADQIRGWLLSDEVIDVIAEAIFQGERDRTYGQTARAAITAALDEDPIRAAVEAGMTYAEAVKSNEEES